MAIRSKDAAAEIAASWWADKVVKPTFDAGADSPAMMMAEVMATVGAAKIEEPNKLKFHNILKRKILDKLMNTNYQVGLYCDYHPEGILAEAMNEANIPSSNAPWKTSMWIDTDGSVSVKYGYGKSVIDL